LSAKIEIFLRQVWLRMEIQQTGFAENQSEIFSAIIFNISSDRLHLPDIL